VRLVQVRDGQIMGRLRPTLRELVGEGESLDDVRATLARFVEGRLLVISGDSDDARVEIGHEWLARHWTRLAEWLRETEKNLPLMLRLSDAAQSWQRQGRAGWLLWRGDDLAELRRALPTLEASGSLGRGERVFAHACIAGVRLRRQKKDAARAEQRLREARVLAEQVVYKVNDRLAKMPGTAEVRRDLLSDVMQVLDQLRGEGVGKDDLALLRLRSVGHTQRGGVALTHDNLSVAAREFEQALAIDEELLRQQPNSPQARRDLSISLNQLGEVAGQMGQLGEAKGFFERSLKLREALTAADTTDAQAQRDLSISLEKLGEVAGKYGQLGEAKGFFERSLKLREALAAADTMDAQAQRDLSISVDRLGEVAGQMGQLGEAKDFFERSLKLREALAAADTTDTQAQRDLSVGFERLAQVSRDFGLLAAAQSHQRRALAISHRLAQLAPLSVEIQRTLLVHRLQLGFLHQQNKDRDAARQEAKVATALLDALRPRLPMQDAEELDKEIRLLLC
jgi:tetratricopeptide (TPR) repeat protein